MKQKNLLLILASFLILACATVVGSAPSPSVDEPSVSSEVATPAFESTESTPAPALELAPLPTSTSAPLGPATLNKDNYKQFAPLYRWNAKDSKIAQFNGIAISSQVERVALITQASNKYTLRLYDLQGNLMWESRLENKAAVHSALTFSPDGKTIAVGLDNGKVQLLDTDSGNTIKSFSYHTFTVHVVAFSPDGTMIASGASDQKVNLWIPNTGLQIPTCFYWDPLTKEKCRAENKTNVYDIAFSPDGRYLAVSANVVVILDVETGQEVDRYYNRNQDTTDMFEVAFSPDGSTLAASGKGGKGGRMRQVLVWNFPSGAQSPTSVSVDAQVEDLVFTPQNDLFLGSYKDKGMLGIFDMRARRAIGQLPLGPKLYMSYTNDLTMFVVLSKKWDVDIWGIPK